MLLSIVAVTPQDQLSVNLPWQAVVSCGSPAHLRCFADILCSIGKVAQTAAFVNCKFCGQRPESLFTSDFKKGEVLKPEVLVVATVWKGVGPLVELLASPSAAELTLYQTQPSIAVLKSWADRAALVGPLWASHVADRRTTPSRR